MRLYVPFKVQSQSDDHTVTLPFDTEFKVKASSSRKAAKLVYRNASRLIQKDKPLDFIEKLPNYYNQTGYNYVVVNLFSPLENLILCTPFFVTFILIYSFSWFFIINLGMLYTEFSQTIFNVETMALFQQYQYHLGLIQTMLFIILWGWFYSYMYPYLRNFYAMGILNNPSLMDLHQSTVGRLNGLIQKKSLINPDNFEFKATQRVGNDE